MVAVKKSHLGKGMYSVAEAAMYARVNNQTFGRWVFGNSKGLPVIEPQFGLGPEKTVSFIDFIQTLAIREIRRQQVVSVQKIREAIATARSSYGIEYPFAMRHATYLSQINGEILIRLKETHDEFVQVTGKGKHQMHFRFVEDYLRKIEFDDENGLARRYKIFSSSHDKPVPIIMDPAIRFGEPMLPSGYSAMSIKEAIEVEGGINEVADIYGLPIAEVETAYEFFDYLAPPKKEAT